MENGNRANGVVEFYNAFGYSILAINGSCKDERPNSKSIFFVKEILTFEKMTLKLVDIPIFCEIIRKMPFDVNLNEFSNG